jgi:hypothetical protein
MLKLRLFVLFMFIPVIVYAQDQDWSVFKSSHFLVFYRQASLGFLDQLSQKAEEYYDEITDEFGFNRLNFWTWDNRAKIYLFDTQEEYRKANSNLDWSVGLVVVGNKSIQSYLTAPGLLDNVLAHELAHIIFREMVGFNNPAVPLWLEEGVATFQEKRSSNQLVKSFLSGKIQSNAFMSLDQLSNFNLMFTKDKQLIELFYSESYSLLQYLVKEFGKDKFVLFCQYLRDYRDLTRAVRITYSFDSLLELESAWKAYILQ